MGKHVVANVDGASREGDTTVQRHMQKHFDHLLLSEAEVQRRTDVAA
jgi:phosphoribulokinase